MRPKYLDEVRGRVSCSSDVGGEELATRRVIQREHRCASNIGVRRDRDFDFFQLQSLAPDLDLIVGATEELEHSVLGPPREVTGAIHARAVGIERVCDEATGCEQPTADIPTAQQESGCVQLAAGADRSRFEVLVQDIELGVWIGTTDRRRDSLGPLSVDDVRDTDRRFRRAVSVVKRRRQLITEPAEEIGGEDFTATPHVPDAFERRRAACRPFEVEHEERIEHR